MGDFVICAPINKNRPTTANSLKARDDYFREQLHFGESGKAIWPDSRANNAHVGDWFCFVDYCDDKMEVFIVTKVDHWSKAPNNWDQQSRRNVLHLSEKLYETSWSDFCNMSGYHENYVLRTTTRLKNKYWL